MRLGEEDKIDDSAKCSERLEERKEKKMYATLAFYFFSSQIISVRSNLNFRELFAASSKCLDIVSKPRQRDSRNRIKIKMNKVRHVCDK